MGVYEKAVASYDEDAITLSIEAANRALQVLNINPTSRLALTLPIILKGQEANTILYPTIILYIYILLL